MPEQTLCLAAHAFARADQGRLAQEEEGAARTEHRMPKVSQSSQRRRCSSSLPGPRLIDQTLSGRKGLSIARLTACCKEEESSADLGTRGSRSQSRGRLRRLEASYAVFSLGDCAKLSRAELGADLASRARLPLCQTSH
eukprot:651687-Rhodomonas_salina.2